MPGSFADGSVAEVGAPAKPSSRTAGTVLDATGCLVIPGLVDVHVHLREPGGEDAEDVASGSAAAVGTAGRSPDVSVAGVRPRSMASRASRMTFSGQNRSRWAVRT